MGLGELEPRGRGMDPYPITLAGTAGTSVVTLLVGEGTGIPALKGRIWMTIFGS